MLQCQGQLSCVRTCPNTASVISVVWENATTQSGSTQLCGNMPQHSQGQLSCVKNTTTHPGSTELWRNILQDSQGQLSCVATCSNKARVNTVVWEYAQTQLGSTQLCGNMLQHSQGQLLCANMLHHSQDQLNCVGTCHNTVTTQKQNKIFENSNVQVMHNAYACLFMVWHCGIQTECTS